MTAAKATEQASEQATKQATEQATKAKKKKKGSARSIETFFRSAYRTQLDLTGLADMKANIMISINGLIITAIIATEGFSAITQSSSYYLPILLLLVCILSMAFAMLAARPRVANYQVSENDLLTGNASLLYFNNFLSISENQYAEATLALLDDTESIYRMMSQHIYNMGVVLSRKYRLLRISYSVFLGGIIITGIFFISRSIF